jgi:hypothetical protein
MRLRSVQIGVITMTLMTSGCSMLPGLAKSALTGSKPAVEASVNVSKGDAEGDGSAAQNANTAILVDTGYEGTYEGPIGTVVNEGELPIHLLIALILLAGWAIPSPSEMGRGCLNAVRVLRKSSQE